MEFFGSSKHSIQTFIIPHSFKSAMQKYPTCNFLFSNVFLHGLSGSLHLVLLLLIFTSWGFQKLKKDNNINKKSLYNQKQSLVTCLCVCSLNIVLCSFSYFSWTEESSITLLDFSIKTISWGLLLVYVSTRVYDISLSFVRLWWGFYLSVSLYCLVIGFVLYNKHYESLLSHLVSAIAGLFFVCGSIFRANKKSETSTILEEPLLEHDEAVSPYSNAGFVSLLSFSWIGTLVGVGYKKTLEVEDVPRLDVGDSVVRNFPILRSKIESECESVNRITTFKLARAVFFLVWKDILLLAILLVLSTLASYVGPYLIRAFFKYLTGQGTPKNDKGYVLVFAFIAAKLVECLPMVQWFFKTRQTGMKVRSSLVALIFNKSLSLSSRSKTGRSSGEIINLMTVDTERLANFTFFIHDPWIVLLQVALALMILYKNIGVAAVSTLVATILVVLANLPLGKLQERFQKKLMASKDTRMRAISEVLRNMRILKLQAWEMKFFSKIVAMRETETGWLRKFLYSSAVSTFVFKAAPTLVSLVTFGTCFLLEIPLDAGKIFSLLATFKILQRAIYKLPDTVSMIVQTKVSFDRISAFLRRDDLPSDNIIRVPRGSSVNAVEIIDGNFSWCESHENPTLKDINVQVSNGMRVAICGTVGSGKTSLLSSILGEIPKISGTVNLCGTKAYVAQSPWIQSGKIEDNILFGKEMDREKYDKVLEACSLKKDLEILTFGDQTIIGERGINLSGGQKQRIQIARALYQDSDIYLFDDPFSAVDAHTGSHLFKECLMGLLSSKTVIYVTHQVEFLPNADLILVIKDGRVSQSGKYNEILKPGTDFIELVNAHKEAFSSINTIGASSSNGVKNIVKKKDCEIDEKAEPKGQLVKDEERQKGSVGFSVYWKYITMFCGGTLAPAILVAQILFQILEIGSSYWMAWASPVSEESEPRVKSTTLIIVYAALSIGSAICVLMRTTLLVAVGYKTATILFDKMHDCIFRAPMSFFDSTPSGRILNRASTDQSNVDLTIFFQIGSFSFCVIQLLGNIAVMSQVAWQVFIVFVPVIAACIWYQRYYLPSARELSRLVGVCKAPVIQHFAETISGVVTIRSFDQEPRFRDTNLKLSDEYTRPKFYVTAAMQWLAFRLDMLSVMTFAFSLLFLISVPVGLIDPGIAGLVITYGLSLNMLQANVIWTLSKLENNIISVERIFQYTRIPSEPPLIIESKKPDCSWPSCGEVEIRNLKVRYAPHLPLVLRGVTCTFPGGLKSGIVGRTGSGKSTLIQTLFRIVDPAAGKIVIDGIDISSIGLHDLRSRLSIIPQDPTMFEGTVRSNLDPLEEYTDQQIWEALDKCQLGDEVRKKEGKLNSTVTENGENWSMGQRQLVCLGRVLLKKSKVLVLDEATASVDTATDNLIQQTLRQHFCDCTVITIAHRITSVLDSDMVLLLSHGLIEEYDSPSRLLENKLSSFAQLVAEYTIRSTSNF